MNFSCRKRLLAPVLVTAFALPEMARAQAWVPTEPSLQLSLEYAFVFSSSDRFSEPVPVMAGSTELTKSRDTAKLNTHLFIPTIDFAPVSNLGLKIWLPMALIKCVDDRDPSCEHNHPDSAETVNVDDGEGRFTLQDFNFEARYMFDFEGVITLAPALGFSVPTNDYATVGHAIVGRGRPQIRAALNIGRALSEVIPGAYVHGRYQFAYVLPLSEDAYAGDSRVVSDPGDGAALEAVSIHRSMVDFEFGYFFFEDLAARATIHWELTHGGVEYSDGINDGTAFSSVVNRNHDVLGAERYFLAGIGLSYILLDELFLSATFLKWITGANTHDSDSINFAVSYTIF